MNDCTIVYWCIAHNAPVSMQMLADGQSPVCDANPHHNAPTDTPTITP